MADDEVKLMASEAETLKKDIDELRKALDSLGKDVGAISKSLAEDAKSRATKAAEHVRDGAKDFVNDVGAKGKQTAQAVETKVRENPLQSLAVAFGAGLIIAQLLRRR
jgi:ElaB/YqjD/DUF883 family membrane-anchored ribosome-binding protein